MKCSYYPASLPVLSCSEKVCKSYFHILALEHRSHFQRQTVIGHYGQERIMLLWDKQTNWRRASCPWDTRWPSGQVWSMARHQNSNTNYFSNVMASQAHGLSVTIYSIRCGCTCCAETCYSKSTKWRNIPTAAMAGALLKIYLAHTSLMVVASIACLRAENIILELQW